MSLQREVSQQLEWFHIFNNIILLLCIFVPISIALPAQRYPHTAPPHLALSHPWGESSLSRADRLIMTPIHFSALQRLNLCFPFIHYAALETTTSKIRRQFTASACVYKDAASPLCSFSETIFFGNHSFTHPSPQTHTRRLTHKLRWAVLLNLSDHV